MALVQKAFSDIITFSRSSNATRVGPTGLVEYAPHNLLTYSQEFDNAGWTKNAASIVANAAPAPDGTITADMLVPSASAGIAPAAFQGITVGLVTHTWSVYAKAAGYTWLMLKAQDVTAGTCPTWFNLSTGVIGSTTSGNINTITSVGNGWYRCAITRVVSNVSAFMNIQVANADNASTMTGDGTSGIYIWGAQLSVGPYALDYVPTTSAAVYGPRFDYDPSGVTIVDPVSRNLLTYSEQFDNAAWTKTAATVTANAGTSPDGTTSADKIVEAATSGQHYIGQSAGSYAAGSYTFSLYLKAAGRFRGECTVGSLGGGSGFYGSFNLTAGTATLLGQFGSGFTGSAATLTSVGNGWYRFTLSGSVSGTASIIVQVNLYNDSGSISYTGDGTSGILLWGAQLELGSQATAYMVSGATNGFRAVPVTSGTATARGLLVEEQRTNTCNYSEDIANPVWLSSDATVTANTATSPDGTVNADSIQFTASNGKLIRNVGNKISVSGSTTYTISVWLKVTSGTFKLKLSRTNATTWATATISPELTVTTDWQRFTLTYTSGSGDTLTDIVIGSEDKTPYTLPALGTVLVWGIQHEAGSFATSYIPTIASTVTRSADVASVNTLSPWFNATEGTVFTEAANLKGQYPHLASFETDTNNAMWIYAQESGSARVGNLDIINGGSVQVSVSTSSSSSATVKLATVYKVNDFAVCLNGGTIVTDTSGTVPPSNALQIGTRLASNFWANGYIRRIAYYPRRLTNAELQALTA